MEKEELFTKDDMEIRKKANQNIEKYRKGEAEINIVDSDGKRLSNLDIEIELVNHEFKFGGWPWLPRKSAHYRISDRQAKELYTEHYCDLFNCGTAMMYWDEKEGFPHWERKQGQVEHKFIDQLTDWARKNNIKLKGHPLAWTKPNSLPDWLIDSSKRARKIYLEAHVRKLVSSFAGIIDEWDVVNEVLWEPVWENMDNRSWPNFEEIDDIIDFVLPLFKWAREENPAADLLINEYGLEVDKKQISAENQRKRYREIIARLLTEGGFPDAIGLQTHEGAINASSKKLWEIWDYFSELGIPLHLTEIGCDANIIESGGQYRGENWNKTVAILAYQNMYRIGFGHPNVEAIITYNTLHNGYQYSGKPNWIYEALHKLISEEWQTRKNIKTNDRGILNFRGFYGDYKIDITTESGKIVRKKFSLNKIDDNQVTYVIPKRYQ
ncbi:MAG: endo-1,4-beta-xylanase [bacterium]